MVKIYTQYARLEYATPDAGMAIERIARLCYNSQDNMSKDSAGNWAFLHNLMTRGHHSPFEHAYATMWIVTNRAIANELVRHRHASYMQESTRYVKYSELEIIPTLADITDWDSMADTYSYCIKAGFAPQIARDVLPLCTATRLYMTANLRAWREILMQRLAPGCHPQMRELAKLMLNEIRSVLPVYFEGLDNG